MNSVEVALQVGLGALVDFHLSDLGETGQVVKIQSSVEKSSEEAAPVVFDKSVVGGQEGEAWETNPVISGEPTVSPKMVNTV